MDRWRMAAAVVIDRRSVIGQSFIAPPSPSIVQKRSTYHGSWRGLLQTMRRSKGERPCGVVWCNSVMLDQPSVCMPSQGTGCPCHRPLAISRRASRTAALQAVNPPPPSINSDAPDRTTPFSQARGLDRPRLWLPAACLLCTCCCRSLALARRRPRHSWPQTPSPAGRLAQLPPQQQQPRHQSLLPGQVKGRPFRAPRPEENPPRLIGPSRSPRPAAAQPTAPATTECRRRTTASEGGGGPCNRSALEF